jgi:hypothetical protein
MTRYVDEQEDSEENSLCDDGAVGIAGVHGRSRPVSCRSVRRDRVVQFQWDSCDDLFDESVNLISIPFVREISPMRDAECLIRLAIALRRAYFCGLIPGLVYRAYLGGCWNAVKGIMKSAEAFILEAAVNEDFTTGIISSGSFRDMKTTAGLLYRLL